MNKLSDLRPQTLLPTLAASAALALGGLACAKTQGDGYHPKADVPENHARVHKPEYRGGEVQEGKLEQPDPQADIERGDPPERVDAAWSDPVGDPPSWRDSEVVITKVVVEACGIELAKAHFPYDSAKLNDLAKAMFAQVAECFDDGALAGRELEIVGFADPRGSDEYNKKLGKSRAESVAEVLTNNGLSDDHIEVISKGESQAHEDTPSMWPADRRVELRVEE